MTLHPYIETNAHVTGCLVCSKPYELVIEEAVTDYLQQTAEHGETVKDRALQRFLDKLQSGVFNFVPLGVSQAAAFDGQVYMVNYSNSQPGTKTKILLWFKD